MPASPTPPEPRPDRDLPDGIDHPEAEPDAAGPLPHESALSRSWMLAVRNRHGERTNALVLLGGVTVAASLAMTAVAAALSLVMPIGTAVPVGAGTSVVGVTVFAIARVWSRRVRTRDFVAAARRAEVESQQQRADAAHRERRGPDVHPSRRVDELRTRGTDES